MHVGSGAWRIEVAPLVAIMTRWIPAGLLRPCSRSTAARFVGGHAAPSEVVAVDHSVAHQHQQRRIDDAAQRGHEAQPRDYSVSDHDDHHGDRYDQP